jgi:hypothetical protein
VTILRALTHAARRASSWVAAGVVLGAVAAAPAGAAPVQGFGPVGSFGFGGSGPGGLSAPQHIAVDDSTGNVFVADPGNGRVEVFQPDGSGSATYLTEFGAAAVSQPYGVAVDQSTGDVYVAGADGVQPKVARFTSDNRPTPTYTLDPSFTSPVGGAGAGQIGDFNSPIAVDPSTHDVIVADRGNKRIDRYSSTGTFIRAFDGSDAAGGLTTITDVAATASDVYVTDVQSDNVFGGGASRVLRFTAAGSYSATIASDAIPVVGAIDADTGNLVVAGNARYDQAATLSVYHGGMRGASSDFPAAASGSTITGIAVGGGANRHVYAVADMYFGSFGETAILTFDPSPAVEADDVTSSDSRSVDLAGVVNPEGQPTTAHFEYLDSGSWTALPDVPGVGGGTLDEPVSSHLAGLQPNTSYSFRLVASDGRTTAVSNPATARTGIEAPTVVTGGAPSLSAGTASIQGTVNPLGLQTTYYFEYGPTTSYGSRSPAGAPAVAGNGFTARTVSTDLSGLAAGTTYHYRLVATNAAGTTYGADATFGTDSADVTREYEMVSPAQKTGVPVDSYYDGFKSRTDGNGIAYTTQKASYDGGTATPFAPRYLGTRSDAGWSSLPLDPPLTTSIPLQDTLLGVLAVSDDLDRTLSVTTHKLGGQGVEGNGNLYIHDLDDDSYDLVATSSDPAFYRRLAGTDGVNSYFGGTSDLSTVAFVVPVSLTPGAPGGGNFNIYSWSQATGLQLVSVLPDGSPAVGTQQGDSLLRDANRVSADGSRIYFQVAANGTNTPGLFLRHNGATTAISESQLSSGPATLADARFQGASPDGRYAIFSVPAPTPLTDDAPSANNDAYRYDAVTGRLTFIAPHVDNDYRPRIARPETGDFYYMSGFDPNGNSTVDRNLYYEHDGTSHLIALSVNSALGWAASPNGRYLAFQDTSKLTSFDNGGKYEIYLYDAQTGVLSCPSCRTDGGPATGDAQMGVGQAGNIYFDYTPRAVLDDGTLFFDSPDPLVRRDTNGQRDVYMERNGTVSLVSPGTGMADAQFVDATPDGSNVFFVTSERLVGQDQDGTPDLYDARVGGGIADQSPLPGPASCGGSECKEPASGPVSSDPSPTMTIDSRPTTTAKQPKPRLTLVRTSVGMTSIRITVTTSARGRIRASGATVRATTRNATKAAVYTMTVPLTQKARKARRAGHKLKLSVRVALTAPFASPVSIKLTRTVGK